MLLASCGKVETPVPQLVPTETKSVIQVQASVTPMATAFRPTPVAPTSPPIPTLAAPKTTVFEHPDVNTYDLAWSPDEQSIAVTGVGQVNLFDAQSGENSFLAGHDGFIRGLNWSPDGQMLASAGDDTTVRIWKIATVQTIKTFQLASVAYSVTWSQDGAFIAAGSLDGAFYVREFASRNLVYTQKASDIIINIVWFLIAGCSLLARVMAISRFGMHKRGISSRLCLEHP